MKINYKKDWNKICATYEDFVNLQESPAGFGDTKEEAMVDLMKESEHKINRKPIRNEKGSTRTNINSL